MDYYRDYLGSNETLRDSENYSSAYYHNNSLAYRKHKPRKSKGDSVVAIDARQYYGSPMSEMAENSYHNNGYFDRRSSYMLNDPYYQNQQQSYIPNRKSRKPNKKYQKEPITPESEYIPNENDSQYGPYDNDSQLVSDDTWTTNDIEDEGEDEDPFMDDTTRKNTELNSEIPAYNSTNSYNSDEVFEASSEQHMHQFRNITPPITQQEQEVKGNLSSLPEPKKKKWYKGIMNKGFMQKLKARKKASTQDSNVIMPQQQTSASTPAVHILSVNNNETLGDVLDSKQQKEIIQQLYHRGTSSSPSSAMVLPLEKQKITSLDRIWVFRLWTEELEARNVAWIGFDFENQLKIEKHVQELEMQPEDGRLAIYDSHIRHKQMPVIITPNDKKGYYFTDMNQTQLVTLEVTFIQNDHQKITFVYRM